MVTIAPNTRHITYNPVTPTTAFPVSFPIFDNGDVKLYRDGVEIPDYTVSGNYVDGVCENATIRITPGIFGKIEILGLRTPSRTDQYLNGRPLAIKDHNCSLNRLTIENQEARRDIDANYAGLATERDERAAADRDLHQKLDSQLQAVTDQADRAKQAAELSTENLEETVEQALLAYIARSEAEAARDIAAGHASDAVSQGNVPIYSTIAGLVGLPPGSTGIPLGINGIRVNGRNAVGDRQGGFFTSINNGSTDTFVSGGVTARIWYRAYDWLDLMNLQEII